MTICNETGLACNCQPDEGVPCSALNGGLKKMMLDWRAEAIRLQSRLDAQQPAAAEPKHSDDLAVDRFAEAMKLKLAIKRAEGRGGWDDRNECSNERLAQMLINHVPKGDPVDIANFAMMIHQRDAQGIENGTIDNLPNGVKVIAFVAAGETADQQPAAASAGASDALSREKDRHALWGAIQDYAAAVGREGADQMMAADLALGAVIDRLLPGTRSPPVSSTRWEKLKAAGFTARPKITNALGYARDNDGDEPASTAHVGDSNFELWYEYSCTKTADPKQLARDAYAAGMGEGATIATLACNPPDRSVATAQQSEAPK